MNFTDQKPWVATESDCNAPWSGAARGKNFRCYLCGFKFKPGDIVRWVFGNGMNPPIGNFLTCAACDGADVKERFAALFAEFQSDKFWSFRE